MKVGDVITKIITCPDCGGCGFVSVSGHSQWCDGSKCSMHGCPVEIQVPCDTCDGFGTVVAVLLGPPDALSPSEEIPF